MEYLESLIYTILSPANKDTLSSSFSIYISHSLGVFITGLEIAISYIEAFRCDRLNPKNSSLNIPFSRLSNQTPLIGIAKMTIADKILEMGPDYCDQYCSETSIIIT